MARAQAHTARALGSEGRGHWAGGHWAAGCAGHGRSAQGRAGGGTRCWARHGRGGQERSGREAGEARARGMGIERACACLGVLSWARLGVLCTLTQFLTWFDSVLFLSH